MTIRLTNDEMAVADLEFRAGRVTPRLAEFVGTLVVVNARSGALGDGLSPTGEWGPETISDVTQSWWEERLLHGTLLAAFNEAATPRALARYLEAALRNWLIDRLRRRGLPRLRERAAELLGTDERFARYGPRTAHPADQLWGLRGWADPEPFQGDDRALLGQAYAVGDLALVSSRHSTDRAEIVIRNDELARLLESLFSRIQALLSLSRVDRLLYQRFQEAYPPAEVAETEVADRADPAAMQPLREDGASAAAEVCLARLTRRQVDALRGRFLEELTLDALAEQLNCSRGTADNELRRAYATLREVLSEADDHDLVLEKLFDLTS